MDSKEHQEIQELIKSGRSPNDEGPFYHHAFWESYKGSVKGKLGGLVVGALVGGLVGAAIFAAAAAFSMTAITGLGALTVIGGLSAAGLLYAKHEFGEVGRITGAVAATQTEAEERMQEFEKSQFAEIKKEISDLKSSVSGKAAATGLPAASAPQNNQKSGEAVETRLDDYRTTHYDPNIPKPNNNVLVFWKVALVGIVVGASAGALLFSVGALGGLASLLGASLGSIIGTTGTAALTGGVIGASFGINRDSFRKVFDRTDLLFKGMFKFTDPQKQNEQPSLNASKERPEINTIIYPETGIDYPTSDTFHRDQLAARANQLLASLDHTTVSRH